MFLSLLFFACVSVLMSARCYVYLLYFRVEFSTGIITYTGKPVVTLSKVSSTVKVTQGTPVSVPFELPAQTYPIQIHFNELFITSVLDVLIFDNL